MNTTLFGRVVFGASSVLYGIIALLWHDVDTWQALAKFWSLPLGTVVGDAVMVALIAGGVALLIPRSARLASIVLFVAYSLCALICIPGTLAGLKQFISYDPFFEQVAMVSGALAVIAATGAERRSAYYMTARIGLGLATVVFMVAQLMFLKFTASLVPSWLPPGQMFWTILTTIAFGLAAIALLANVKARLAASLMTAMLVLFGLLVWVPALVGHPQSHGNWSEFAINFQIAGAAWLVAQERS